MGLPHPSMTASGTGSDGERLSGTVKTVTFHNSENGYCILKVKVTGRKDPQTVIGYVPSVAPGQMVSCHGNWATHKKHGPQFAAQTIVSMAPSSAEGIEKYLSSGRVKGIGPEFARKLVDAFGEKTLEVIEREPWRLRHLKGIGPKRIEGLIKGMADHRVIQELMVFLHTHGLGASRAARIYKIYGENAIHRVKENPYRLAIDIDGIGFKIADDLARKLGIPHDSDVRARAGVRHTLNEAALRGHCALPLDGLTDKTKRLLNIPEETVSAAIRHEVFEKALIQEQVDEEIHIFLPRYYHAERGVARHIHRLRAGDALMSTSDAERIVLAVEAEGGITLASAQRQAVVAGLTNKFAVITGGPGVGKTTVIKTLLDAAMRRRITLSLSAPTGRASKRMAEATGRDASTIHRLLEPSSEGFRHNEHNPLELDLLVLDEFPMVDVSLAYALLRAVPDHACVILVGDCDQLPSVGPGAVMRDIIASDAIPVVELTEIFRQGLGSRIVVNAHRIIHGQLPLTQTPGEATDFYFFNIGGPESEEEDPNGEIVQRIQDKILEAVTIKIPQKFGFDPVEDIQLLTPIHRGLLGTQALNEALQSNLNSPADPSQVLRRFGQGYAVGDKVIQLRNDYDREVFNGDVGRICRVNTKDEILHVLIDGREVAYESGELDELSLAYAMTIHKSQGSEYPCVVLPLSLQHTIMLERQLLYTGVTRGKSLVVLIGQQKALQRAVKTAHARKRITNLANRLRVAA